MRCSKNLLRWVRRVAPLLLAMPAAVAAVAQSAPQDLPAGSAALLQPAVLAKALQSSSSKPIIFYVGPRFLYAQAHIRGAEFIGPASEPDSAERLRKRVVLLPRSSRIVLYCGCCPWEHCPNIRPAYRELAKMGFTNVKALYLANNFGSDWVEKGYPVEKGDSHP